MKVLIADDHPLVRQGLAVIVQQWRADAEPVFAADAAELLDQAVAVAPDIALVDLAMPGMLGEAGVEGLRALRARCPALPVIVASAHDDARTVRAVLSMGASGFVAKNEPPSAITAALQGAMAGEPAAPANAGVRATGGVPAGRAPLTARQLDVLSALMHGRSNKAIAEELGLTEGTVKIHVAAVLRALRAHNRTEAVVHARALGLPPKA